MIDGFIRHYGDPLFLHCKKHFCPKCGTQLDLIKCSRVVNSFSSEAKNFNFLDGTMGNIEFNWDEFICPNCGVQMPINTIRQMEYAAHKEERRIKKEAYGGKRRIGKEARMDAMRYE